MNLHVKTALILAAVLPLTGFFHDRTMDDLERFTENAYKDKKPDIEPLPVLPPVEGFEYAASGLKDPFNPGNIRQPQEDAEDTGPDELAPDPTRRKEPLEQFPLDALRMVGSMFRDDGAWVVVRSPDGSVHRITLGNYLGQDNGEIVDISEERVSIREVVMGPRGRWEERLNALSMVR